MKDTNKEYITAKIAEMNESGNKAIACLRCMDEDMVSIRSDIDVIKDDLVLMKRLVEMI